MQTRYAVLTAIIGGLTLLAEPALASRSTVLSTAVRNAPSNLGFVSSLDQIREDRDLYQVRVKLDNGSAQIVVQERLNDVRVGDRVEIDGNQVYRHDTRAERVDRWGYRVDAAGNRYDDEGFRVDEGANGN